jgi:regulator of replication initiation timing
MAKFERETDTDMFADVREQVVQIPILEEIYQDILRLCQENEWEKEEGLRTVLTFGLGYLRGEQVLTRLNADEADPAAELQAKVEELSGYQSMYAVMKFKAFKLWQVARTLEMNVAGLRAELDLCRSTIPHLRERIAQLVKENARLLERLVVLGVEDSTSVAEVSKPAAKTLEPKSQPLSRLWTRITTLIQRMLEIS